VVNEGGLLVPNELAAHKLVDAIGDFALGGLPILGQIEVIRGGHASHLRALSEAVKSGILIRGYLNASGTFTPES
jgi:UDP-3-O-[3-hydroxymyristoyl] N-acetylglucosamine deacetylase